MFARTIFLTIATATAVKAEHLFEFADELPTVDVQECKAKGLGK